MRPSTSVYKTTESQKYFCGLVVTMRKVSKSISDAVEAIELFQDDLESGYSKFKFASKEFARLTYAAKKAAADCGLKFTYGRLWTGNNRQYCKYLYFPGRRSEWYANGHNVDMAIYTLRDVTVVRVTRETGAQRPFRLEVVDTIEEVDNMGLLTRRLLRLSKDRSIDEADADVTLKAESLKAFLTKYTTRLIWLSVIKPSDVDEYWGLHGLPLKDATLYWRGIEDVYCYHDASKQSLDAYLPNLRVPGDDLLFAATIFSLLKPLFRICNLKYDVDFVLQLHLTANLDGEAAKEWQDALWLLELQTHMWCDYRPWPDSTGYIDIPKFRGRYHVVPELNFQCSGGFPILLFGYRWPDDKGNSYDDNDDYDDEDDIRELSPVYGKAYLSSKEIGYLINADCLPILIPLNSSRRNYPNKSCVTLSLDIPHPASHMPWRDWEVRAERYNTRYSSLPESRKPDAFNTIKQIHGRINQYYMGFMDMLNGAYVSDARKRLVKCYKEALSKLNSLTGRSQIREGQLAAILGTLYFVKDTLTELKQETGRLYSQIRAFENSIGVVSIASFASFVTDNLNRPIVSYQDEAFIYLSYKAYWPAFQRYCSKNGIALTLSAAAFRRNILAPEGLISPQYEVSSGSKYSRYDYRKKVDGKEEIVLKLSRKILDLE